MSKLKGCLITDMENLQQEYYCLWSEAARKREVYSEVRTLFEER